MVAEARRDFGCLTPEQLNWKPNAEAWSVGQCFEHLVKTNEQYLPTLEQIVGGGRKSSFWERHSPLSGLWGRFLVRALQPESARRIKTTAKFQPASSVGADVLDRFAEQQSALTKLIEATKSSDLEGIVITSPFNAFVTYNLLDAYRGVLAHERRHAAQARRVTEMQEFPGGAGE